VVASQLADQGLGVGVDWYEGIHAVVVGLHPQLLLDRALYFPKWGVLTLE